jgi:hypothetical protein
MKNRWALQEVDDSINEKGVNFSTVDPNQTKIALRYLQKVENWSNK